MDMLDGSMRQITWSAGASITVQAWEQVIVNGLEPGAAYRLSEREEDRYTIYATEKQTFLEITQKEPAGDQPVKGTVQQNPLAVIVNQVREFHPDSEIRKVMAWDAGRRERPGRRAGYPAAVTCRRVSSWHCGQSSMTEGSGTRPRAYPTLWAMTAAISDSES